MILKIDRRSAAAALVALLVAFAAASGAGSAAAPTVNTATDNDTSFTSDLTDGDTLGANNTFAANDSKQQNLSYVADSNDTKVEVTKNGSVALVHEDSSPTEENYNSSTGESTLNATIGHDDLADVEHAIGENTTLDVTMVNNTTVDNPGTTTIQVHLEWDNSTTVENVNDADVDSAPSGLTLDVEEDNASEVAGVSIPFTGNDKSEITTENREVNGSDTDVVLVFSNSTVADDFESAASDAAAEDKLSALSTGILGDRNAVLVESDDTTKAVPVFYESAPSSVSDSDTYAVYTEDHGGESAIVVNLGDDFEDANDVDVTAAGSVGILAFADQYLAAAIPGMGSVFANGGALVGTVVFAAPGRRGPRATTTADSTAAEA